ncbi:MAG: T9SS type A sorting domain-containing protein [Taibaiella sp.]|nr:T9SS type A sorting domain-containing protein [Taibaiella sp.]
MNRYFLLFCVLCAAIRQGYAQSDFAPPGAHWYNWAAYGQDHYHSYTDGDSIINGKNCRIIRREAITGDKSNSALYFPLCVTNNNDTVFFFNARFNAFTPLFIFNVHDGDTIRIPEPGDSTYTNDTFIYRVDSVRMVLYDTAWLKTVFTTSIMPEPPTFMAYSTYQGSVGDSTDHGRYIEKIGGFERGIYPECQWCPVLPSWEWRSLSNLWCYNDPTTTLKFKPGECDPPVTLPKLEKEEERNAWPNPASEVLYVNVADQSTIILLTSDGRELLRKVAKTTSESIDVSSYQSGFYTLRTIDANVVQTKKIAVQH